MFGSRTRPGMRGRNSLDMGGYLPTGDVAISPMATAAPSEQFGKFAVYAAVAADVVIALGGAYALWKALKKG